MRDSSTNFILAKGDEIGTTKGRNINTKRLMLRPFQADDLDLFVDFFANEGFIRFSSGNFTRQRVTEFVNKVIGWNRNGLPSQFVVHVRETGDPIGYCGFFHQKVDGAAEIEIGYRLHPDYWNQGFATEAAGAVRDHGFGALNLNRLVSLIHPDNAASRRVAEKNGMIFEKATVFKDFPTQVFAIGREHWLQLRGASKIPG